MTNQFTELETITDEELMAASGGIIAASLGLIRGIGGAIGRIPKKAPGQLVNGLTDAVTSQGDLQDLVYH